MEELSTYSIEDQIKKDLKECEFINELFDSVKVVSAYEIPKKPTFPIIVVEEIYNRENSRYTTLEGEQATNLSYSIVVLCETTKLKTGEILSPKNSTKLLMLRINKLLGGEKYQMKRAMNSPIVPQKEDNSVMGCEQIYETVLFKDTLYRK